MTSHELARALLEMPDNEIRIYDEDNFTWKRAILVGEGAYFGVGTVEITAG